MTIIKQRLRHARQLFNSGNATIDRHNRRAWVRNTLRMGDRWVFAKPVSKEVLRESVRRLA